MYRHFLNLISQDFWCPHLFASADITVPVYTSKTPPSSDHIVIVKLNINICTSIYPIMSEAFRRSLDCYYNIALLIGQWAELIMQSHLLSTTYAYDSQQVIYKFDKMRVKVNTQRSRVKKCNTQRLPPIK